MTDIVGLGVIQVEGDTTGFEAAMRKMEAVAKQVEVNVAQSLGKAAAAGTKVGDGVEAGAAKADAATKRFTTSIDRQTAAIVGGVTKQREVQAQQLGVEQGIATQRIAVLKEAIGAQEELTRAQQKAAQARAFAAQLEERFNRTTKTEYEALRQQAAALGPEATAAFNKYGAALTGASNATRDLRVQTNLQRQAMRGLPAQVTDIVTSLAGGQNALLVLLQQGGQIKDQFGSFGAAFRGILSFINPVTLAITAAVGAVAALGYAVVKGEAEISAFRRSLALTGNAAGTTVGNLGGAARAISADVGTFGKAAETLAALAATGRVAAGSMQLVAEAAIRLEREGGPAVEKTVEQFAELGRSPTQAAAKLNESTRFLTLTLYEQIKALEQQGRTAEAAAIAQQAFALTTIQRTKDLEKNLGFVERGMRAIASTAKAMWDAILNIGRPSTIDLGQSIAAAEKQLAAAQRRLDAVRSAPARPQAGNDALLGNNEQNLLAEVEARKKVIEQLREQKAAVDQLTQSQKDAAAASEAAVRFSNLQDQFKTPGEKLRDALDQARTTTATVRGGAFAGARTDAQFAGASAQLAKLDADAKKLFGNIVAYSEAAALAAAAATARLGAVAAVQAEQLAATIQGIQQQATIGTINEYQAIEQLGEAQAEASKQAEIRLAAELAIARTRPNNAAAIITLEGQIQAQIEKTANIEKKAADDIAAARRKREIAAEQLYGAERQLQEEETRSAEAAQGQRYDQAQLSLFEYSAALKDAAFALDVERQASVLDERQREIALRQLQIELQLRQQLRDLDRQGFDADKKAVIEQGLRDNAAAASQLVIDKVVTEFQTRAALNIQKSLTDALIDGVDRGWDYLKSLARRSVLEIFLKPIVQPIAGFLSTVGSAVAGTGGDASAFGQASNAASLFNAGKTIYSGFEAGFANVGHAAANAYTAVFGSGQAGVAAQYGTAVGSQQTAMLAAQESGLGTAAGGNATLFGAAAQVAAGVAVGIYGGRAISGGFSTGGSGNANVNVGTTAGAIVGGVIGVGNPIAIAIGAAIGGVIGGAVNRLFGRRAPEVESREIVGQFGGGGDFTGSKVTNILEEGGVFKSDRRSKITDAITGDLDKALDEGGKTIADLAKKYGEALGLPVDSLANVTKQISVEVTSAAVDDLSKKYGEALNLPFVELSEAGKKIAGTTEFAEAVQKDAQANADAIGRALGQYGEALLEEFAPALEGLRKSGETTAEVMERVGGALLEVNDLFDLLGLKALDASLAGAGAAVELAELFGGLENLGAAAGSYYANFYTEQERAARGTQALTEQFAEFGQALPKSRDAYRALVEAQDLTTESGREIFAMLLQNADAFNELENALGDTAEKAEELAEKLRDAIGEALPKFQTPAQQRATQFQAIATNLQNVGVSVDVGTLMRVSKDEILAFATAFVNLSTNGAEAKLAVVEAASALADLKDEAADAAKQLAADLSAAIDNNIARFLTPEQDRSRRAQRIADNLSGAGVQVTGEQLLGLTPAQVYEFAKAFVLLESNTTEAKIAVVEAAGALGVLFDELADVAITDLERSMEAIEKVVGDIAVLEDPIETLSETFIKNRDEAKRLRESLEQMLGTAAKTAEEVLGDMLESQRALSSFREGLTETIFQTRLRTLSPGDRIASLRREESNLFGRLQTDADPAAVAQKLQAIIIQRIQEEGRLREGIENGTIDALTQQAKLSEEARRAQMEALREQIDASERLQRLAKDIAQFTGSLRFSDLSSRNFEDQLFAARALYEQTLSAAMSGDETAQGNLTQNARAYLEEARSFFASSAAYAAIFESVLSSLDMFGADAAADGANLSDLERQLKAYEDIEKSVVDTSAQELAALETLAAAVDARAAVDQEKIDKQIELLEKIIARYDSAAEEAKREIERQVAVWREHKALLDDIRGNGLTLTNTLALEALRD